MTSVGPEASRGSALPAGQPRLTYEFLDLKAGATTLAAGGAAVAKFLPEERTLAYSRGAVEERYLLRPDALEQTFVIRSLPPGPPQSPPARLTTRGPRRNVRRSCGHRVGVALC